MLISDDTDVWKEGRKFVDTKYTVHPHPDFVGEQKGANKRGRDDHMRALQAGVDLQPSAVARWR